MPANDDDDDDGSPRGGGGGASSLIIGNDKATPAARARRSARSISAREARGAWSGAASARRAARGIHVLARHSLGSFFTVVAIRTVSPCAAHSVQRDVPLGLKLPLHPARSKASQHTGEQVRAPRSMLPVTQSAHLWRACAAAAVAGPWRNDGSGFVPHPPCSVSSSPESMAGSAHHHRGHCCPQSCCTTTTTRALSCSPAASVWQGVVAL